MQIFLRPDDERSIPSGGSRVWPCRPIASILNGWTSHACPQPTRHRVSRCNDASSPSLSWVPCSCHSRLARTIPGSGNWRGAMWPAPLKGRQRRLGIPTRWISARTIAPTEPPVPAPVTSSLAHEMIAALIASRSDKNGRLPDRSAGPRSRCQKAPQLTAETADAEDRC